MRCIRQRRLWLALAACGLLLATMASPASAESDRPDRHRRPSVPGMIVVPSERSFDETWSTLIEALEANPNIGIVARIDHAAAAESVGLELDPNRVAVFGNPALGSPLMQVNQVTGIDLPQKIQVFERHGRVWVGFNDASYLRVRHRLGDQPTLETIAGALRALAGQAADREIGPHRTRLLLIRLKPGLITMPSNADLETTWGRLLAAIEASPANIAFEVDHEAGAESAGLDLRPTRLVAFGNPQLGTPLMQAKPTAGIDLPIKFLVWEDADGVTQVSTNDPRFIGLRHRLRGVDLDPITAAVDNFLRIATEGP